MGALTILGLLTGCLAEPSPTPIPEVGVHVSCRPESCPDGRVLIEIGSTAWEAQDADGTALAPADSPVDVRILDPDSCEVFAEFTAEPHSRYVVEVAAVGPSTVMDTAHAENIVFPMGPSTLPTEPSDCP
jgi:hypothetical protein